ILLQRRGARLAWILSLTSVAVVGFGLLALWNLREVIPLALFVSVLLGCVLVSKLLVRFVPSLRF
ncbi:MAG: hypothetical protein AAFV69_04080, partial [Pseudomonadota bacterium]